MIYGDSIIIYPKSYSMYLRGTIGHDNSSHSLDQDSAGTAANSGNVQILGPEDFRFRVLRVQGLGFLGCRV